MSAQYEHHLTLHGMRDAVLSISFSAKGKFVAATGYGGVAVWDLSTTLPISLPLLKYSPQNPKYVISTSTWLYFSKPKTYILVGGAPKEMFEFQNLHRFPSVNATRQVLSLDVHRKEVSLGRRGRIAAVSIDGSVTVWTLTASGECTQVFSINLEASFLPKVARFCPNTRDVFVFSRSGGLIQRLDYKTGNVKQSKSQAPSTMGSVALDQSSKHFAAWTAEGFQIYRLDSLELIQTFETQSPIVHFPKHVVYGENDDVIVGGTDRGHAMVFTVGTGQVAQTLIYPRGGLVQHVSSISLSDHHLIAIAGSTRHQPAEVLIFRKPTSDGGSSPKPSTLDRSFIDSPSLVHVVAGIYASKSGWRIIQLIVLALICAIGLSIVHMNSDRFSGWVELGLPRAGKSSNSNSNPNLNFDMNLIADFDSGTDLNLDSDSGVKVASKRTHNTNSNVKLLADFDLDSELGLDTYSGAKVDSKRTHNTNIDVDLVTDLDWDWELGLDTYSGAKMDSKRTHKTIIDVDLVADFDLDSELGLDTDTGAKVASKRTRSDIPALPSKPLVREKVLSDHIHHLDIPASPNKPAVQAAGEKVVPEDVHRSNNPAPPSQPAVQVVGEKVASDCTHRPNIQTLPKKPAVQGAVAHQRLPKVASLNMPPRSSYPRPVADENHNDL
ncbi:WD40-repeat-containing domain protein [Lentinula raphanica]|uniref:WD40-repeat-containing domain protein n=1 Tax=Lentinula raphanica TaxID=153919 RepID=A0AA38P0E0_9AGAR|nr:WD40-repeat-containing domain protein [Lentinula raphanica]